MHTSTTKRSSFSGHGLIVINSITQEMRPYRALSCAVIERAVDDFGDAIKLFRRIEKLKHKDPGEYMIRQHSKSTANAILDVKSVYNLCAGKGNSAILEMADISGHIIWNSLLKRYRAEKLISQYLGEEYSKPMKEWY